MVAATKRPIAEGPKADPRAGQAKKGRTGAEATKPTLAEAADVVEVKDCQDKKFCTAAEATDPKPAGVAGEGSVDAPKAKGPDADAEALKRKHTDVDGEVVAEDGHQARKLRTDLEELDADAESLKRMHSQVDGDVAAGDGSQAKRRRTDAAADGENQSAGADAAGTSGSPGTPSVLKVGFGAVSPGPSVLQFGFGASSAVLEDTLRDSQQKVFGPDDIPSGQPESSVDLVHCPQQPNPLEVMPPQGMLMIEADDVDNMVAGKCCSCARVMDEEMQKEQTIVIRATTKCPRAQVVRCKDCHNLLARIRRISTRKSDVKASIVMLPKPEREAFMLANHEKFGADLELEYTQSITEITKKTNKSSFKAKSNMFRWSVLETKYKDEPHILAAILRNARRTRDTVKEIDLFEDTEYSIEHDRTEEDTEESKRKAQSEDTRKKAKVKAAGKIQKQKKLRDADGALAIVDGEPVEVEVKLKKMTEPQKVKINKMVEKLSKIVTGLSEDIDKAASDQLVGMIPAYVVQGCKKTMAMYGCFSERTEKTFENGFQEGEGMKQLTGEVKTMEVELEESSRRLHDQVAAALEHINGSA